MPAHERSSWRPGLLAIVVAVAAFSGGVVIAEAGARFGPLAIVAPVAVAAAYLATAAAPARALVIVIATIPVGLTRLPELPLQLIELATILCVGLVFAAEAVRVGRVARWEATLVGAFLLVGWAAISTVQAADRAAATGQTVLLILGVALAMAASTALRSVADLERTVAWLLGVGAASSLLALISAGPQRSAFGGAVVVGRAEGLFTQPNELGSFAAIVTALAVGVVARSQDRRRRLFAGGAALATGAAMVLSLSRGAWLGAALGVATIILLSGVARRRLALLFVPLAAMVAIVGLARPSDPQVEVVRSRVLSVADPSANPYDDRPAIYAEALRQIRAEPLLGYGPASFPTVSARATEQGEALGATHAHNALLTVGAELGVTGLALFIAFSVAVGVRLVRGARAAQHDPAVSSVLLGASAALASVIGHGVVDYPLRNPTLFLVAWLVVGLALAAARLALGRDARVLDHLR